MSRTTPKEYYALLHAGRASMMAVYFSQGERQAAIAKHEARHIDFSGTPITRAEAKQAAASAFGSPDYVAVPDPIRALLGVPYQPAN